jgi:hypothetical protein
MTDYDNHLYHDLLTYSCSWFWLQLAVISWIRGWPYHSRPGQCPHITCLHNVRMDILRTGARGQSHPQTPVHEWVRQSSNQLQQPWFDSCLDSTSALSRLLPWFDTCHDSTSALIRHLPWFDFCLDSTPALSRLLPWVDTCLDSTPPPPVF